MPTAEYESRTDSVLAWKKAQKLGRFDPDAPTIEQQKILASEREVEERGKLLISFHHYHIETNLLHQVQLFWHAFAEASTHRLYQDVNATFISADTTIGVIMLQTCLERVRCMHIPPFLVHSISERGPLYVSSFNLPWTQSAALNPKEIRLHLSHCLDSHITISIAAPSACTLRELAYASYSTPVIPTVAVPAPRNRRQPP